MKEMEKKLDSLLRDFEYHAREMVSAVQDRAAAQKVSKDAERASPSCAANFANSSIPPSSLTQPGPTRTIPMPSRNS